MTRATRPSAAPTSSVATRVLGGLSLVTVGITVVPALFVTPSDVVQGEAVRLMYVHLPTIWVAYMSFVVAAVASALYLWPRTRRRHWDRVAGATAEVGAVFTGLCLVSGMMWGRITWGVYWQWDARLTTTLLLFVVYLGYLAVRRLPADPVVRSKRSAIVALIAVVNVVIVRYSVDWWNTLHQKASLTVVDPEITGEMLGALFFALGAFSIVAAYLVVHRYRLLRLEEIRDEEGLQLALDERRAEAMSAGGRAVAGPEGTVG
jgi:heme exporter protein C